MEAFKQSAFVHIMTIDFVLLTLLSMIAIYRDTKGVDVQQLGPRQASSLLWVR